MTRSLFLRAAAVLAAGGLIGWAATGDHRADARPKPAEPAANPPIAATAEAGIRAATAAYATAFNAADAAAAAALWTAEGEYVGADGDPVVGRPAIEKSLAAFFKAHPKATADVRVESVRVLGRGLASAEGVVALTTPGGGPVVESRYTALHVLEDGAWRTASVREWVPDAATDVTPKHLDWLVGEWTSKGPAGEVRTTFAWDDAKVFLTGKYTVTKDGKPVSAGTQMIGRNPAGGLRSWLFDSSGTTATGVWVRDDDRWVHEATGVLPDGTEVTSVNVLIPLGRDAFTWQTTDREVNGTPVAALPPVKVTRVTK